MKERPFTSSFLLKKFLILFRQNAHRKKSLQRGGDLNRIDLREASGTGGDQSLADDLIALDEALTRLACADRTKAELVKLRYFAGLTLEQAAEALGISRATAARHWTFARAWLYRQVRRDG